MNRDLRLPRPQCSMVGFGLSALVLLTLAGTATAQPDRRPDGPRDGQPALRGPDVRDNSVPGEKRRFAPGKGQGKDRLDDRGTPPRLFMQAIRVLKDNETPDDARLTPEQDKELQSIQNDFRGEMKAYLDDHREEVQGLREKIGPEARAKLENKLRAAGFPGGGRLGGGPGDGPGTKRGPDGRPEGGPDGRPGSRGGKRPPRDGGPEGGPDAGPEGRPDGDRTPPPRREGAPDQPPRGKPRKEGKPVAEDPAAAQRLVEIMEGAPKFKDAEARAWAVLTDRQRPIVKDELAKLRENGPQRLNPGEGRPGKDRPTADGQREKVRDRLENLSPEERERLKQKIQDRRAKRGPANGQPKPPPPMDDVDVPPPPPEPQ